MIPIELQDFLVSEIKDLFDGYQLKNTSGESSPLHVYPQYLPSGSTQEETDHFPYVRVTLVDGEDDSPSDSNQCRIILLVGVWDDSIDNQGYRDMCSIVQKTYTHLMRHRVFENRYEMTYPIRWSVADEDLKETWPFFFGALETTWTLG